MHHTKAALLSEAKRLNIRGRHEMSRDALASAILAWANSPRDDHDATELSLDGQDIVDELEREAESSVSLDPEVTKDRKRRYPSEAKRDPVTRRVIRKGVKFNMNVPFREKLYYLPSRLEKVEQFQVVLAAAPPQVRAIAATMLADFGCPADAARGRDVVARAKSSGRLTSKIDDDMLFAYYRRVLETVGVVHWQGEE